jgi:hypothetical protein
MMKNYALVGLIAIALITLSGCNTLQSITVRNNPKKTVYGQGQSFDPSGLLVSGIYKKGDEKAIYTSNLTISGYDRNQPGEQTISIAYRNFSASFTVTVLPLQSISMDTLPIKTIYREGENFEPSTLSVKGSWRGLDPEVLDSNLLDISGYHKSSPGTQTIQVSAYGKSTQFQVTVVALQSIRVDSPPARSIFKIGESLNLAGITVVGVWDSIGSYPIALSDLTVSGYDNSRPGDQTLSLSFEGKTTSLSVKTVPMTGLHVTRLPYKTRYRIGERLNMDGLQVSGSWPGIGTEAISISPNEVSGFDSSMPGVRQITLSVNNLSVSFPLTVVQVIRLIVERPPDKTLYIRGQDLDLRGLRVLRIWSDGQSEEAHIGMHNIRGYDKNKTGQQNIIIRLDNLSTSFMITVTELYYDY